MQNTKTWKVYFFQTARGEYPVKEFLDRQEKPIRTKILNYILLLHTNGPYLKPPYIKKLESNLYELRITTNVAIRIFYTMVREEYYLLHAFTKKSQKTPSKELKTAIDRMREII